MLRTCTYTIILNPQKIVQLDFLYLLGINKLRFFNNNNKKNNNNNKNILMLNYVQNVTGSNLEIIYYWPVLLAIVDHEILYSV